MYQTPEKVFRPGNTIFIQYSDSIGQLKECNAVIKNIIRGMKENKFFLELDQQKIADLILEGKELTVCFEGPDGKTTKFGTYVIEKKTSDGSALILANPVAVDYTSFRRYIRADVDLPFRYFVGPKSITGKITNLSGCGLFGLVAIDKELNEQITITVEFSLPGGSRVYQVAGKIVRIEFIGNPVKQGVALDFESIDKYNQTEIAVYVTRLMFEQGKL